MRNLFRKQIDTFVSPMFDHSIKEVDEYILKVELSGVPFKVCREIAVPSDIYAGYLAELLVLSVGWCGTHMHEILKDGIRYPRLTGILTSSRFHRKISVIHSTILSVSFCVCLGILSISDMTSEMTGCMS